MKTQTPHAFYRLGSSLRYLLDAKVGWLVKGETKIHSNILGVIKNVEELQLPVTLCALQKLRKLEESLGGAKPEDTLSKEQATELHDAARSVREVVNAELKSLIVYAITPKKFPTDRLIADMSFLFPNGVYAQLSALAQYDIAEAGKCIAFERPTAAAFHLLRATEDALKDFYCFAIKNNRVGSLMMGTMISDMRQKRKTKHLSDLIACLDNIRSSYRNPTQHPEKIYDMDEVQNLLGLCADAMTKLSKARLQI
jgi:hypothetical protein